jgi:phosphoacetylglucosamine mutase
MLEGAWEAHATTLANATSDEQLFEEYNTLVSQLKINTDIKAKVIVARDTRESGPHLVQALLDALTAVDAGFVDHGILTTPQLHYLVRCINTHGARDQYGEPTEEGYYHKLANAYKQLMQGVPKLGEVTVDCANGVGAPKLRRLAEAIGKNLFECKVINDLVDEPVRLNYQVCEKICNCLGDLEINVLIN